MHDDLTHPYRYDCPIHGAGYGELDECPKCMQEADKYDICSVPNYLCWRCRFCESEYDALKDNMIECRFYGHKTGARKKRCRHFQDLEPEDESEEFSDFLHDPTGGII